MACHLYLCGVEMPELPSDFSIKTGNKNQTVELLNGDTINILKSKGLQEISLTLAFPMMGAKKTAEYYLARLNKFKKNKKPTQFIFTRTTPNGTPLDDTNIKVSIEDYTQSENATKPFEMTVDVDLKEYVDYGTQKLTVKKVKKNGKTQSVAKVKKERETNNAPKAKSYTVKQGDTLWAISAKYLGSGAKYMTIYNANRNILSNPNIIKAGQVLTIPT